MAPLVFCEQYVRLHGKMHQPMVLIFCEKLSILSSSKLRVLLNHSSNFDKVVATWLGLKQQIESLAKCTCDGRREREEIAEC